MKKGIIGLSFAMVFMMNTATVVYAHAVVKPSEVGIRSFQTFTIGVPNERNVAVTGVRLSVPDSLEHVMPTVKPGWKIQTKEETHDEVVGKGDEDMAHGEVSEVAWTGGAIPVGQRDDFTFSAKVPAVTGNIVWKIYQTYADGSVIAWDLTPGERQPQKDGKPDYSSKGPASVTQVIEDLAKKDESKQEFLPKPEKDRLAPTALALSCVAVIASAVALRNS